jgi:hypothetical protein
VRHNYEKDIRFIIQHFIHGAVIRTGTIGGHLTIKFPTEPKIQQFENKTVYSAKMDSSYFIYVSVTDMHDDPNFCIQPD